jgi:hypothetical protein
VYSGKLICYFRRILYILTEVILHHFRRLLHMLMEMKGNNTQKCCLIYFLSQHKNYAHIYSKFITYIWQIHPSPHTHYHPPFLKHTPYHPHCHKHTIYHPHCLTNIHHMTEYTHSNIHIQATILTHLTETRNCSSYIYYCPECR